MRDPVETLRELLTSPIPSSKNARDAAKQLYAAVDKAVAEFRLAQDEIVQVLALLLARHLTHPGDIGKDHGEAPTPPRAD